MRIGDVRTAVLVLGEIGPFGRKQLAWLGFHAPVVGEINLAPGGNRSLSDVQANAQSKRPGSFSFS